MERILSHIAKFMGPTWGPPGSCRPQMVPILAPWTLLSGIVSEFSNNWKHVDSLTVATNSLKYKQTSKTIDIDSSFSAPLMRTHATDPCVTMHVMSLVCLVCLISVVHQWLRHDDVIKSKHFPRNWPFVRGIHRSPVNSPHKGQWRGALMMSLIWA